MLSLAEVNDDYLRADRYTQPTEQTKSANNMELSHECGWTHFVKSRGTA